jgi:indole-3-glycerol phosphate synthase
VQVSIRWTPPAGTLGKLVAEARDRVLLLRPRSAALFEAARAAPSPPSFSSALRGVDVAIVAEVKRRSPSRGVLNASINAPDRAAAFVRGGAVAVSILTEPLHFGGTPLDLETTRARVSVPLLRKDFLIDVLQLIEARALGAAAALLIVRALDPAHLAELVSAAVELGLEPLVEAHTETELERAVASGARVIGINNRDLETLQIDATTVTRLIPEVPAEMMAIAESGVRDRADVMTAAAVGSDAVLIGSVLSAAADPAGAVGALTGVPRLARPIPRIS